MGRQPCCEKEGLKRGPWTLEEDSKLMNFILNNGIQCWRLVPKLAGLMRCGKSCRLRWINYLRPDLKRGAFTDAEEDTIIELHSRLGNRWSKIAAHFPGRTDNEIKNHWNTRIKKKMRLMGLDPLTHKPIIEQKNQDSVAEISEGSEAHHQNLGVQENYVTLPPLEDYYYQVQQQQQQQQQNTMIYDPNYSTLKNSDIGPIGNFSMGPLQNWMDSPFMWDGFSSLGDHLNFP